MKKAVLDLQYFQGLLTNVKKQHPPAIIIELAINNCSAGAMVSDFYN